MERTKTSSHWTHLLKPDTTVCFEVRNDLALHSHVSCRPDAVLVHSSRQLFFTTQGQLHYEFFWSDQFQIARVLVSLLTLLVDGKAHEDFSLGHCRFVPTAVELQYRANIWIVKVHFFTDMLQPNSLFQVIPGGPTRFLLRLPHPSPYSQP